MLTHYATQFSTVEADNTYYAPARKRAQGWNEKPPTEFVMSAKFPRSVVHGGEEVKLPVYSYAKNHLAVHSPETVRQLEKIKEAKFGGGVRVASRPKATRMHARASRVGSSAVPLARCVRASNFGRVNEKSGPSLANSLRIHTGRAHVLS